MTSMLFIDSDLRPPSGNPSSCLSAGSSASPETFPHLQKSTAVDASFLSRKDVQMGGPRSRPITHRILAVLSESTMASTYPTSLPPTPFCTSASRCGMPGASLKSTGIFFLEKTNGPVFGSDFLAVFHGTLHE